MKSTNEINPGNLLNLYTNANNTEFINGNEELKNSLNSLNVRIDHGVQKVISVEEEKINGLPIEDYEPILVNEEWLNRLHAIPKEQSNIEIGKLRFKRTQIGLIYCNDNFDPIAGEKLIRYVHQLQNLHADKTGEELHYTFPNTV